jgi:RNA polymerase sigma-70 factor (ECF subfamily)
MEPWRQADHDLAAAAEGDADAFANFYQGQSDHVLRYFSTRVREPELAADLMAETFAAALLGVRRYRPLGDGSALAWIFAIARNKLASSRRRGQVEAHARERLGLEPLILDGDDLERVRELADIERRTPSLGELVNALPDDQRRALIARIVEERDYPALAVELRCSEAIVRKRVSRAVGQLRRAIGNEL